MAYFLYGYIDESKRTFYQTRYKISRPTQTLMINKPRTYSCYADPAMETLLDKSTLKMRDYRTTIKLFYTGFVQAMN